MSELETQYLHASTLIRTLHPYAGDRALIEITGLAGKARPVKRYFTRVDVATEFAIETANRRLNVFVSANPRTAMSGFEHDVPFVSALPLDLQVERTDITGVSAILAQAGIPPTITAVSGYGAHMYLCIEPEDRHKAKLVAERLIKLTRSDSIQNSNRIMRCAGTRNWKRSDPQWCALTGVDPSRRYRLQDVDDALNRLGAPPARQPKDGIPITEDLTMEWSTLRQRLSGAVLDIIDTGEKNAYSERQVTNSEADWLVVCALVRECAPDKLIHWIYETQPIGCMKYRSAGAHYLHRTIESARRANADQLKDRPVSPKRHGAVRFTGSSRDSQRAVYAQRQYRGGSI